MQMENTSLIPLITLITVVMAWNGTTRQVAKLRAEVASLKKTLENSRVA
jgi:hypothetical protein